MSRLLFAILLSLLLLGCSTTKRQFTPAGEPADGDMARLRGIGSSVFVNPNICGDRPDLNEGALICVGLCSDGYNGRSIGMPQTDTKERVKGKKSGEMYVRSGHPLYLSFIMEGQQRCFVGGSFTPEKDHDYEAVGIVQGRKCYMIVTDISDGGRPIKLGKPDCEK